MLNDFFKTALRNLYRYKGFSLINILGLAIGVTGCLLIGLFVWDEWKYDSFIKDQQKIYRLYLQGTNENSGKTIVVTPPVYANYIRDKYPEVEDATRLFMWDGKKLMELGEKKAYENKGLMADSNFFTIFPLEFARGNAATALADPASVVLTEALATKYFGTTDPIGKTIMLDKEPFIVKAVLAKVPEHFHLDFHYVLPMAAAGVADRMNRWGWQQFFTYVKLKEAANLPNLQQRFAQDVAKETKAEEGEAFDFRPLFQPLKDIHLHSSKFEFDNAKRGNVTTVHGLTIIAIFILVIACFNFVNLATARSFRRAKEIGVRKVAGAGRRQLVIQFTGETVLLALMAVTIAVIATFILLPMLNAFTDKTISFNLFTQPALLLLIVGMGVVIGILSGIYPALFMSGFMPIKVLKGLKPMDAGGGAALSRKALVVIQFALSALLIICTLIAYKQTMFLHRKDLGFNKDLVLYFSALGGVGEKAETFKTELKKSGGVVSVTGGYGLPGDQFATDGIIVPHENGDKQHGAIQIMVDHDYVTTMGLTLMAGRDFSRQMPTDVREAFIINETAVKELGFGTPEKAIGQPLKWDEWIPVDSLNPVKKGKVIGVVKDFHMKSLHEKLNATVLQIYPQVLSKIAVKVKADDLPNTLQYINNTWNRFAPDYLFDYKFLDENLAAMYKAEDKLTTLLIIATGLAIFVSCLGLFGLSAFSVEQRSKEISVRKVLGASAANIVTLLSKTFLKPVGIAYLIAFPIAWWAMNNWLQDFEYRIKISWIIFVTAALVAFIVALLTISFQSIKAATTNPIKSLRSE